MLRKILLLVTLVFMPLLGACAGRSFQVQVNGYTEPGGPPLSPGAAIYVAEDPKAANPLLEKEVKAKIERLLVRNHYTLAPRERAHYVLTFAYGLGAPQTVAVTTPGWGWGLGVGYGWGRWAGAYSIYWPGWGPYHTEIQPLYERWLRLKVVEAATCRREGEPRPLWVGEAKSLGTSSDLREVLNFLLLAVFDQFGRNTGKAVTTTLRARDPRLAILSDGR